MNQFYDSYENVSDEYYDESLHPTCSNFRELSSKFFTEMLETTRLKNALSHDYILETGAGKSLAAETLLNRNFSIENLEIQDQCEEMLSYSLRWQNQLNQMFLSDAREMGVSEKRYNVVLSFLLDPYNDNRLWDEIYRVLKNGGIWLFTTPSHEWSTEFRSIMGRNRSTFLLKSGEEIDLPSYTYPTHKLISFLKRKNFSLSFFKGFISGEIEGEISQKLVVNNAREKVLDGYLFTKIA